MINLPEAEINFPSISKVAEASLVSDLFAGRESIQDRLVESAWSGYEQVKESIRKTVYNDKGLDLPQLSIEDTHSGRSSKSIDSPPGAFGFHKVSNPADRSLSDRSLSDRLLADRHAPRSAERGIDKRFEITSDGREREFNLHIPPGYDGTIPMPLVVVLHGLSQDADSIAELSKMSEKADKEGFIVAYPNATKWLGMKSLRAWDADNGVQIPGTDSNDVGFIRDMVSTIKKNMNIDDKSVYAAGFSNGGMLTLKLASEMSDTFSAVAVVSSGANGTELKPGNKVSIMAVNGTEDRVVPLRGRVWGSTAQSLGVPHFEPLKNSFKNWTTTSGIAEQPPIVRDGDVISSRGVNPETGTEIVAYAIKGGRHEWPGSDRAKRSSPNSAEAQFQTTDKIWEFFKSHKKPGINRTIPMENMLSA